MLVCEKSEGGGRGKDILIQQQVALHFGQKLLQLPDLSFINCLAGQQAKKQKKWKKGEAKTEEDQEILLVHKFRSNPIVLFIINQFLPRLSIVFPFLCRDLWIPHNVISSPRGVHMATDGVVWWTNGAARNWVRNAISNANKKVPICINGIIRPR